MRRLGTLALFVAALAACTEPPPARRSSAPSEDDAPLPSTSSVASASASASAVSPPGPFEPKKVSLEQPVMGTRLTIVAYTTPDHDETATGAAITAAYREIARLEQLMSTWVETSEVSRINAAAGKEAIGVGPDTLAVIEKSQWIAKESGGLFDITFDAMHGIWKFDQGAEARVPPKDVIDKARKHIDYRQVVVDHAASTVKLSKEGARINLGGIAKGYAVDAACRVLDKAGIPAYFVQAGGDLYVKGRKPGGTAFRVGVRDPRSSDPKDSFAMMSVEDHAFSTAGDYERAFILDGKRYHHIIDPRTGYPATASRSVTVWAKDAFTADAIDDAVFILGPKKGLALVESIDGAGAVIVDQHNKVWISKRLEDVVQVLRDPTDGP